ncbi:hypothetical protein APS67_006705 [Streptomyces sp. AVP053U2]|nr:hypothetical protein APS67_006705 [Streptomyces sp. AVP053U2]
MLSVAVVMSAITAFGSIGATASTARPIPSPPSLTATESG